MDVIDDSLTNGIQSDDDMVDEKPNIIKQKMVGTGNSRIISTPITLRVPVDGNITNSGGSVPYRVLPLKMEQLNEGEGTTSAMPMAPILTTHLSGDVESEPRLALIATAGAASDTNQTVVVSGNEVFLISETPAVTTCGGGRTFIPRSANDGGGSAPTLLMGQRLAPAMSTTAAPMTSEREQKRRVTHNEVERRRRDKINNWICKLAKILPGCDDVQPKSNQVSKGMILAKACDHIEDLKWQVRGLQERLAAENTSITVPTSRKASPGEDMKHQSSSEATQLRQLSRELELLKRENDSLKHDNATLKNDNGLLKTQMQQHGILPDLAL